MTDISMQGATLTIVGADDVGSVTFRDLSDEGTPIGFGDIQPVHTSKTLNGKLLAWHAQTTPEFTLSVIPNSDSDKALRALLMSSVVHPNGKPRELNDILLKKAVLTIPGHAGTEGVSSSRTYTFTDGFLVGGMAAIGSNQEGRMVNGTFRFQWEDVTGPQ